MPDRSIVYVVDDDEAVRRSLTLLLRACGHEVQAFGSAKAFLEIASVLTPGCVLLDVRMPEMDGLRLQQELNARRIALPIVVVTGHGDVAIAVKAMKAGAVDFLEKPYEAEEVLEAVSAALARLRTAGTQADEAADAAARVAELSTREREVLEGLLAGRSNKMIAGDLGLSPRTVEIHRAHMMERLGVRSLPEAVRLALAAGLKPSGPPR